MGIEDTIKAISNYGLSLVLSALVIYIIIKGVNLGFNTLSTKLNNKKHDKLLEIRQEVDEQVYQILNEFMAAHKGTRIQLVEFTNSVQSVAYLPFKYMSCTYEVFTYGCRPCAKMIDKLSTSLFSQFLVPLNKEGVSTFDLNDDVVCCGAMKDLYSTIGEPKVLFSMIKSNKGKSIGYVSLSKATDFDDDDVNGIINLAAQLYALLGILDN